MTEADTEIPRSRSIFIQSDRVRRDSPRAREMGRAACARVQRHFGIGRMVDATRCEYETALSRGSTASGGAAAWRHA